MALGICLIATRVEVKRWVPIRTLPYAPVWTNQTTDTVDGCGLALSDDFSQGVVSNDPYLRGR